MREPATHLLAQTPGRQGPLPGSRFTLRVLRRQQPWERNSTSNSETPFPGLSGSNLVSSMASARVRVWIYLGSCY